MFFISLMMLVFCMCLDTALMASAYQFNDLASAVEAKMQNPKLAASLRSLQEAIDQQNAEPEVVARKAELVRAYIATAGKADAASRALLRARQESGYEEERKLLAKIRTELGSLEFERQEKNTKKCSQESLQPAECSTAVVITTAPFIITTPGFYCVGADFVSTPGIIEIVSSNVVLSLDTHSFDTGTFGIVVENASNVKITGLGSISNFSISMVIQNSQNVIVENISINTSSAVGILCTSSENIEIRNCSFTGNQVGIETQDTSIVRIANCFFTGSEAEAIGLDGGSTEVSITNCLFDANNQDIVSLTTTSGTSTSVAVDSCFMSNTTGGNSIDLTSVTQFALSSSLFSDMASGSAISLTSSTDIRISDCEILAPSMSGISLQGANQNVLVSDCLVLNAQVAGVTAQGLLEGSFIHCLFAPLSSGACSALQFSQCESIRIAGCICSAIAQNPETAGTNGVVFNACTGFSLADCQVETNARSQDDSSGSGLLISNGCMTGDIQGNTFSSIQPTVANFALFVQGDNQALRFTNNTVDGAFRTGMRLDGTKFSQISNNLIRGVQQGSGITLKNTLGVAVIGNTVINNETHGIHLDKETKHSFIYGNTVQNNKKNGIKNNTDGHVNKIYHNFAKSNKDGNYFGVDFVVKPGEHVGAIENISG
jgi:parallel beta-helix repeat protein